MLSCAERVLPRFDGDAAAHADICGAVERTRAYSAGESSAGEEIKKCLIVMDAATAVTTPAGAVAARAVGQAVAGRGLGCPRAGG